MPRWLLILSLLAGQVGLCACADEDMAAAVDLDDCGGGDSDHQASGDCPLGCDDGGCSDCACCSLPSSVVPTSVQLAAPTRGEAMRPTAPNPAPRSIDPRDILHVPIRRIG